MITNHRIHALTFTLLLLAAVQASAFFDPHIGRWASRDPIGQNGGQNLHVFVQNCPSHSIDVLGLLELDSDKKKINVGRCEIAIIYGHSGKKLHWQWNMGTNGCNAGTAITCWPKSNSEGLSPNLLARWIEALDDTEVWWGSAVTNADSAGLVEIGPYRGKINAKWLLMKAEEAALAQARAFCNKPCCCPTVAIRFIRTRKAAPPVVDPPDRDSDDAAVPNVQSYNYDCKRGTSVFLPGK
jgi:hypothetical protein